MNQTSQKTLKVGDKIRLTLNNMCTCIVHASMVLWEKNENESIYGNVCIEFLTCTGL